MASREVVGDEYIAIALGIKIETVRIQRIRRKDFPKPIDPKARVKLFPRAAADRYISKYRAADAPEITPPAHLVIDLNKTVGLDYIARELRISLKTARTYAADGPQRPEGFPTPVNNWVARAEPLYDHRDADVFIASRLASSAFRRGRLNAAGATRTALKAAAATAELLGHEINLDNRRQLQHALFSERGLPSTEETASGPSVSTGALVALYKQHPDEVLQQVLIYRDVPLPTT